MGYHLSQAIATEKDTKDRAVSKLNQARGILANKGLLSGIVRTYTPKDEDGEKLPSESTRVQYTARGVLEGVAASLAELFDMIATKDFTNCIAKADIVVDGTTLLKDVPATYILFLEKQLAELLSFVKAIPTLDDAEKWDFDSNQGYYATGEVETIRSKKVLRNHVLAEATKEHPAQVQVYQEDVPAGRWKTIKYSGTLPATELGSMITRVEKLQKAVKFAREEANRTEAIQQTVGAALLKYVFD